MSKSEKFFLNKELTSEIKKMHKRIQELENSESKLLLIQKTLSEIEERSHRYLEIVEVILVGLDSLGYVTFINKKGCQILGMVKEDILGKDWFKLCIPKESREDVKKMFLEIISGKITKLKYVENEIITKAGDKKLVGWTNSSVKDKEGNIIGTLSSGTDITHSKQFQLALQKSEARFDMLIEKVRVPMFIYQGIKIIYVNPLFEMMTQYNGEELIALNFWDIIHPDYRDLVKERGIRRQSGEDMPPHYEVKIIKKSGEEAWVDFIVTTIEIEHENAVLGIMNDITERKKAERKLENMTNLLKASRDITKDLLVAKDEEPLFQQICQRLIGVNYIKFAWIGIKEKKNLLVKPIGYAADAEGSIEDVIVKCDETEYGRGAIGTAIKTGVPCVVNDIAIDPKFRPWRKMAVKRGYYSCVALPLVHDNEVIGTLSVYSGLKNGFDENEIDFLMQISGDIAVGVKGLRAEKKLMQHSSFYQMMLEGASHPIFFFDINSNYQSKIIEVNHIACTILGCEKNTAQGIFFDEIIKIDERLSFEQFVQQLKEKKTCILNASIKKQNGEFLKTSLHVRLFDHNNSLSLMVVPQIGDTDSNCKE